MRLNKKSVSSFAAALAMVLALGGYSVHASENSGAATLSLSQIRIDNFGQINSSYYRGAQPEGRDYADLAKLGVKTVIDLRADFEGSEASQVKAAGMSFVRIPMTTHVPPTAAQQAQFLELVTNPANQPVYVHCAGGKHRTGVMTAIYRMSVENWTSDRAFREMKQYDFGADFLHSEFKRFVYAFQPNGAPRQPTIVAIETPGIPAR